MARVEKLSSEGIITSEANAAFETIEKGRNDFYHMNKNIKMDYSKLETKAKSSVDSLFKIEKEIFDHSHNNGKIVPNNLEYWDISSDGTTRAFLRFSSIGSNKMSETDI